MFCRSLVLALVAAVVVPPIGARAADEMKYPNFKGQWNAIVTPGLVGQQFKFDPTKDRGLGQQAPLTEEYRKVHADSMADQAKGGLGNYPTARCLPGGMPRMMASEAQEYIVTPETTYILLSSGNDAFRRIYTDGRDWPRDLEPSYQGYAIGLWVDEDGDGTYDVLEVETRGFKGPRAYDEVGLPLHFDNQSVFKERIYRDKTDPKIMHDVITTIDNALTRPWTVDKRYVHNPDLRANWPEYYLAEGNAQVMIGKENYFLSWDGLLMPAKKNQAPPDVKYFQPAPK